MRVLVVKTSSLGDIIHTLPALSDAQAVYPDIQFDWVVEESMQNIPAWHKAVSRVIPVAQRRWRKNKIRALFPLFPLFPLFQGEFFRFIRELKQTQYDLIIDAQGLLKSAWIAYLARGKRAGYSWQSAREPWASLFYHQKAKVSRQDVHAVERVRALFAESLNYPKPNTPPDYGICIDRLPLPNQTHCLSEQSTQQEESARQRESDQKEKSPQQEKSAKPYFVFLHGTTWATKHWPENYWLQLGKMLGERGHHIKLMWGNAQEQQRAQHIAREVNTTDNNTVEVLPKQSLEQAASVLAHARVVISMDTGLGHLAAALNVPTISIYGPSDPVRTGAYGLNQIHLKVDNKTFACAPCFSRTCLYQNPNATNTKHGHSITEAAEIINPPCFATVSPHHVMQSIDKFIHGNASVKE